MTTASRFISRWEVGNTIGSLTILSLGDTPDGKLKPKTCTVLCADCGQTSEMRTDTIHTRRFRHKVKTSCKSCNFKSDNDKRSKAKLKNKLQFDYDRFAAGNEIGKLKIISVHKPDGVSGVKWKITSECQECGETVTLQDAFLIQKFTKGIDLCRFCAEEEKKRIKEEKKKRIKEENIKQDESITEIDIFPIFTKGNKTFDIKKYQISKIATKFSFMLSAGS